MQPRQAGEASRWLPLKLARLAFDGLASFSTVPLRLSSAFGLLVSMVAFIYMIWVMTKTLMFGDAVRGYPTLLVAVLFFAGVQLIFLGVIGEYLGRVYEEVKARPLFLVREEIGVQPDDRNGAIRLQRSYAVMNGPHYPECRRLWLEPRRLAGHPHAGRS